ncbi:transposase [Rugamonas aquatica]|uniref:transposase n=1 Tax=Rugamonas aquatica TaxID=2743357 RepID=UPI001C2D913E|nr:transposase [Rugamonas aquatica]
MRASFRPGRDIAELRTYLRAREKHTDYAAAHIQHMQKALTYMNIQLHYVIATITGVTGMRIIRAIVAGEHDPDKLAAMRDVRCKEGIETIRGALVGNYRPEHLFALRQSLALYDFYQQCIDECDAEIEKAVAGLNIGRPMPDDPLPKAKHRSKMPSDPNSNVRRAVYQLAGTDLTQIHGVGPFLALRLIGECGTDMSRWWTARHFTSWRALSPGCKSAAGRCCRRTRVKQAADLLSRSDSRRSRSGEAIPRSVPSTAVSPSGSAMRRQLQPLRATSQCCFTTPCVTK